MEMAFSKPQKCGSTLALQVCHTAARPDETIDQFSVTRQSAERSLAAPREQGPVRYVNT